ncbi:MAG TPA: TfoX/Sxy family protein [Anaerolineales bacterium]|nr:TfoX/Sxy family protein [Anaerolineales bacterium]
MAYDEALAERIRTKLKGKRGLTETRMFGGVGFLVNGNMACGVIKQDMIVRLSPEESRKALKNAHVRAFDMTGRPMKGWYYVAPGGLKSDKALERWVEKAFSYARSLPPK